MRGDGSPVQNPVDATVAVAALEPVKRSRIWGGQDVAKRRLTLYGGVHWSGENSVTGRRRRTVEITRKDDWPMRGHPIGARQDDFSAGHLNGFIKIQVRRAADQFMRAGFKAA